MPWLYRVAAAVYVVHKLPVAVDASLCPFSETGSSFEQALRKAPLSTKLIVCDDNFMTGPIPDWIGQFENLTTIDIRNNQLTAIPTWDKFPRKLQLFSIERSMITSLPDTWQGLPDTLRVLNVIESPVDALPSTWNGIPEALEILAIENTKVTKVPDSWQGLRGQWVTLIRNKIKSIPSSWQGLSDDIMIIDLSLNVISSIPSSWTGLPSNLEGLELRNNSLSAVPSDWNELPSTLVHLSLDLNLLEGTMPDLGETVETLPPRGKGMGWDLLSGIEVCAKTHHGELCESLVQCVSENGHCQQNTCYGLKGNGTCSSCKDGFMLPLCEQSKPVSTASPTSTTTTPGDEEETPDVVPIVLAALSGVALLGLAVTVLVVFGKKGHVETATLVTSESPMFEGVERRCSDTQQVLVAEELKDKVDL